MVAAACKGSLLHDAGWEKTLPEKKTPGKPLLRIHLEKQSSSPVRLLFSEGKKTSKRGGPDKFMQLASLQGTADLENCSSVETAVERVDVEFVLERRCQFGQSFYIVGSGVSLGQWRLERAVPLEWHEGDVWTTTISMPAGAIKDFKLILRDARGAVSWQPGPNRVMEVARGVKGMKVICNWDRTSDSSLEVIKIPPGGATETFKEEDGLELRTAMDVEVPTGNGASLPKDSKAFVTDPSYSNGSSNGSPNGSSNGATHASPKELTPYDFSASGIEDDEDTALFSSIPEPTPDEPATTEASEFEGNDKWFRRWSWTNLLSTLGRKPLMEEKKE